MVCRNPPNLDFSYAAADLDAGDCKALAKAHGIRSYSLDNRGGVHEDGILMTTLLLPVYHTERPVSGVDLRVEGLFVRNEIIAAAGPPTKGVIACPLSIWCKRAATVLEAAFNCCRMPDLSLVSGNPLRFEILVGNVSKFVS